LTGAIVGAIAAVCLATGEQQERSQTIRVVAVVAVLVTVVAAFSALRFGVLRVVPGTTKAMRRQMDANPAAHITQTGWNAYSRIDAVEGIDRSELARLFIDSDAWTGIREWDGRIE